jgi:Pentapeptide repeats (8 copies)
VIAIRVKRSDLAGINPMAAPAARPTVPGARRYWRKGPRGRTRSPNVVPVMKRWAASQRRLRWTPGGIAAGGLAPAAARAYGRGRLLALGAGLLATGALVFVARSFARYRAGQVTGRYIQAQEQLGCAELDVRIGGISALERVARDSPSHHPAAMEMLAAFIRERSGQHWPPPGPGGRARERSPRTDVQAAITVVGRRLAERDLGPVDLAGADLAGADLTGADLTGAVLAHAVLARADLLAAKLVRADLSSADLGGARLTGANLDGADLTGADLTDADLAGAVLSRAVFTGADLTGALWPAGGPIPPGWQRHPGSGQLIAAGTSAERAEKNQPHR